MISSKAAGENVCSISAYSDGDIEKGIYLNRKEDLVKPRPLCLIASQILGNSLIMCGILFSTASKVDSKVFRSALDRMAYRGPDAG